MPPLKLTPQEFECIKRNTQHITFANIRTNDEIIFDDEDGFMHLTVINKDNEGILVMNHSCDEERNPYEFIPSNAKAYYESMVHKPRP